VALATGSLQKLLPPKEFPKERSRPNHHSKFRHFPALCSHGHRTPRPPKAFFKSKAFGSAPWIGG
jgi:hypothetical protein